VWVTGCDQEERARGGCAAAAGTAVLQAQYRLKVAGQPGTHLSMKPKSMWMMWPSSSSRMLPLCLRYRQYMHTD
jgi:hypothetical protein